jgi:AhpD family alkylhydroperoxidase
METAPPTMQKMREEHQAMDGVVLNPTQLMRYDPTIAAAQAAPGRGIEPAGHLEAQRRSLRYAFVSTLNGCPFCVDINAFRGMREGWSAAPIAELTRDATSPQFSAHERLALGYAGRITRRDQDVDAALFARLLQEFPTPAAIVELTAIVAFETVCSTFNHALGIKSNGVCGVEHAGGTNAARGTGP